MTDTTQLRERIEAYRLAAVGAGDQDAFGSLPYVWSDKPHRLVSDLCCALDAVVAGLEHNVRPDVVLATIGRSLNWE